jgi:uncharacterized damage-inducible protein DinB
MRQVGEERMGSTGVAGEWAVKDVIAHLTRFDRSFVHAFEAHMRGAPLPADIGNLEATNDDYFAAHRHEPLAAVLADSERTFERLLELVEAHSEPFLTEPQQFDGMAEPVYIAQSILGASANHYRRHMPAIRAWLDAQ